MRIPEGRFRCTACGACCRGWQIPLVDGEAAAFRQAAGGGVIAPERLARAVVRVRAGGGEVDALSGDGGSAGCAALRDDQLCAIHATHGEPAKPRACRLYPFSFVRTPDGEVRVGVSHACPAVLDGEGPTLEEQRGELERLWREAAEGTPFVLRVDERVQLTSASSLPWAEARVVLDAVEAAFAEPGPLATRFARAGALVVLAAGAMLDGKSFRAAWDDARSGRDALVADVMARPPDVDRLSRGLFRALVGAARRRSGGFAARLGEAVGAVAAALGGGSAPSVTLAPRQLGAPAITVEGAEIARVTPGIGDEGEALVVRATRAALSSLEYFGDAAFGLPVAGGLDLLALEASLVAWIARAEAAADRRREVALEDVKRALAQVASIRHRGAMPSGLARALDATATIDLLREQLEGR
jgi:lysine-N-methylase